MMKIGSLLLTFMLFASLGFAAFPSCLTSTSVASANFTTSAVAVSCAVQSTQLFNFNVTGTNNNHNVACSQTTNGGTNISDTTITLTACTAIQTGNPEQGTTIINIKLPASGNYTYTDNGVSKTIIDYNATDFNINGTYYLKNSTFTLTTTATGSTTCAIACSTSTLPTFNYTSGYIASLSATGNNYANPLKSLFNGNLLLSDQPTTGNATPSYKDYCQSLLYFNNPYYGNIQLIPKITYNPGINAFAYFYNSTSNAAYIPNNTISYIYDSITNIWYIVPATICTSYSTILSTSTLQYNPTGTTVGQTGTLPVNIFVNGTCSYNTGTRTITCIGSDPSNTVTSLNLTAYALGNTTPTCSSGVAGSSATLTCVLPAVNGTYNAIFYGTDANLYNYIFGQTTIQVGSSVTQFGRDAFLAAVLIFGVAAMLFSGSIAVSMVLGCFALFASILFGIIPAANAMIFVLFCILGFVIAYRLKV